MNVFLLLYKNVNAVLPTTMIMDRTVYLTGIHRIFYASFKFSLTLSVVYTIISFIIKKKNCNFDFLSEIARVNHTVDFSLINACIYNLNTVHTPQQPKQAKCAQVRLIKCKDTVQMQQ